MCQISEFTSFFFTSCSSFIISYLSLASVRGRTIHSSHCGNNYKRRQNLALLLVLKRNLTNRMLWLSRIDDKVYKCKVAWKNLNVFQIEIKKKMHWSQFPKSKKSPDEIKYFQGLDLHRLLARVDLQHSSSCYATFDDIILQLMTSFVWLHFGWRHKGKKKLFLKLVIVSSQI